MRRRLYVIAAAFFLGLSYASAQTPPGAGEIARFTGLNAAAHANNAAAIAALAASGADANLRDERQRTAVHIAAHASAGAALEALAAAGADMNLLDDELYDPITIAAVANDLDFVKLAIKLGGNPAAITSIYVGTALISAAHLGHAEVVAELIRAGAPLDHVNNLGWTALIEAVILGDGGPDHIQVVRSLVEAGADKNIADRSGVTPLVHARARGYADMVALLN